MPDPETEKEESKAARSAGGGSKADPNEAMADGEVDPNEAMAAEWAAMAEPEAASDDNGLGDDENDRMAAEWAAQVEEDAAGGDEDTLFGTAGVLGGGVGQPTRVLNQDEIDSLLGFDQDDDEQSQTGIQVVLDSGMVSYERLPMLDVVFDRLVRTMTTSLRNFTSENVEVLLDSLTSARFGDYLNSIPLPAMLAVFEADEWDNYALLTVDSALIYSVVDVLLGGRHSSTTTRVEGRPYTTIERNLVERMVHVILADLGAAFDPLTPVNFRFDRLETNPRFAAIARPGNAAFLVTMRIDMEDRGGKLEMILPYATLEPIRELLLQMFMGEKFGRDAIWETHLAEELWRTDVEIEAVLDEQTLPLKKIANLRLGDVFQLNARPDTSVLLRCGGVPMVSGKMGRKGNNIAICVDKLSSELRARR